MGLGLGDVLFEMWPECACEDLAPAKCEYRDSNGN